METYDYPGKRAKINMFQTLLDRSSNVLTPNRRKFVTLIPIYSRSLQQFASADIIPHFPIHKNSRKHIAMNMLCANT